MSSILSIRMRNFMASLKIGQIHSTKLNLKLQSNPSILFLECEFCMLYAPLIIRKCTKDFLLRLLIFCFGDDLLIRNHFLEPGCHHFKMLSSKYILPLLDNHNEGLDFQQIEQIRQIQYILRSHGLDASRSLLLTHCSIKKMFLFFVFSRIVSISQFALFMFMHVSIYVVMHICVGIHGDLM